MSELSLVEQQEAIQEQIVAGQIEGVKLSRHKKVAVSFALDIMPIANPFEFEVVDLAAAIVQLDGQSAGIIEAHNVKQTNAVAIKNAAAKNPDRWSQDPAKVETAERALYAADVDVSAALPNEAVNDIASINQEVIDKTSALADAISKRDAWENARVSYKAIAAVQAPVTLDDAIESLRNWVVGKASGEYEVLDIVKDTGLSFRQVVQTVQHMLDVFAPTTLISTTYIR